MKKLLFLTLFISSFAFGQGVRVGDSLPFQSTAVINGVTVIVPVPNATPQICGDPVGAVPCPNKVTTYTDKTLGTPCPTSTQVVLAGTSNCVAQADALGNWGAWVPSGNYNVTFTNAQGQSYGPIPVTANSSPSSQAWSSLTSPTGNLTESMAAFTTAFNYSSPSATNPLFSWNGSVNDGVNIMSNSAIVLGNIANSGPLTANIEYLALRVPGVLTQNFHLVRYFSGSPISVGVASTSDTAAKVFGICTSCTNALSENMTIAIAGVANCAFDGASTALDWVTVSGTVNGDCHDAGASIPATTVTTIGRVLSTNGSAGTYPVLLQISR